MKKILLLLALIYGIATAQTPSCCSPSMNDRNKMLAMNEEFAKSHLAPTPFFLQNGQGNMISFKTPDGKTGRAYYVKSDIPTDNVLFVFQEWWGLNDYIKQVSDKYKEELGNVNIYAIDLYDGKVATSPDEAQKYMSELKEDRANAIIQGAIEYVGPKAKIATIGWCMGGGWSLQAALIASKKTVGCVVYYGMPEKSIERLKTLNSDVIGFYGTQDKFINPEVVKAFQKDMNKAGKKLTVHNYDAVHAFANPSNPKFNKEYAEDAHTKALAYLKARFK
jgi:carboxymethylenebutenolidase